MRILMYHEVSKEDPADIMAVRRDSFYEQMTWLKINGYQVTALSDLFSDKQSGRRKGSLANASLMSWDNAREMASGGIQFGSHSVTHPHLNELEARAVELEVQDSRRQIEEQLEQSITLFSYPYSSTNPSVYYALRKAGYTHACTYRDHYVGGTGHNLLALQRIIVLSTDTLEDFTAKVRSNLRLRLRWYRFQLIKSYRRLV